MKKIIINLFIIFILTSCWEKKDIEINNNKIENIEVKSNNEEIKKSNLETKKIDDSLNNSNNISENEFKEELYYNLENNKINQVEEWLLENNYKLKKIKNDKFYTTYYINKQYIYYIREDYNSRWKKTALTKYKVLKSIWDWFSIKRKINEEWKISEILFFSNKELSKGYHYEKDTYIEDNKSNENFTIINLISKVFVVWTFILDKENSRIYDFTSKQFSPLIIKKWKSWVFILFINSTKTTELIFINNNWDRKILDKWFTEKIKDTYMDFKIIKRIYDFELMINKKVKIFYTEDNIKKEKIIQIDKVSIWIN